MSVFVCGGGGQTGTREVGVANKIDKMNDVEKQLVFTYTFILRCCAFMAFTADFANVWQKTIFRFKNNCKRIKKKLLTPFSDW